MTASVQALISQLEEYLPNLQKRRGSDVLANDFYEALDDWSRLGRHVLERDTRLNYPIRARNELALWAKLESLARSKPPEEQQQYMPMLKVARELLKQVETIQPPKGGHLGVLRVLREYVGFLRTEYGFAVTDEQPMAVRFSSGAVYVKLECSNNPSLSCSFGPEG